MEVQFEYYVNKLLETHQEDRVFSFEYKEKIYWVKQPEKLSGIWLLLKPHPKRAFRNELETLLELEKKGASVPHVVYCTQDFFVLEDTGNAIPQWLNDKECVEREHMNILFDASSALIDMHNKGLVHGRPAIRDITWKDGHVTFLDFEARSHSCNQNWLISRDMLFFFHSLCREEDISNEQIKKIAVYYQSHCHVEFWQTMMKYLQRFKWIYYVLWPFKPIAKKDLIAIYRLFELLLLKDKK